MALNQLYRALKQLGKYAMNPVEYLKRHHEEKFSEPIPIDLGEARYNKEYTYYGDVLIVEDIDGTAYIRLNDKENSLLQLRIGRKIYQDFWRFYITNTPQEGKTLNLIIGRAGCFDITETDYWLNLLKDKQDESKIVLDYVKSYLFDGVKSLADRIKDLEGKTIDQSALATKAKQDLQATIAKQDEIIERVGKALYVTPSDNILAVSTKEVCSSYPDPDTMTINNEIRVVINGTYRVTFDMKGDDPVYSGKAQIHKNGSPIGKLRQQTGTVYVEQEPEEFSFIVNDLVQLYYKADQTTGHDCCIKNLRVKGDIGYGAGYVQE